MSESPPKEARFHSLLFTRLKDYIDENQTPFAEPTTEQDVDGREADIYIPSHTNGSLVIEVKRSDTFPRRKDVIKQARDYADDLNADFFATCNSESFFLFNYQGQIDPSDIPYYSLKLTNKSVKESVPEILEAVSTLYNQGELPRQTERDRVVNLLHSFHASIWPAYKYESKQTYNSNEKFINQFDKWVHENDYSSLSNEEQHEVAAKQYAYLLTNKILFYEVVREKTPDNIPTASGNSLEPLTGVTTIDYLDEHIRRKFDSIVEEIDYKPIFNNDSSLFENFPENKKTKKDIHSLVEDIENISVGDIDEDLLGGIYEELIPKTERKALGQFYTPPKIAETIVNWCLRMDNNGTDDSTISRILDPASGSGTFSVESYKGLNKSSLSSGHQQIIDNIVSIDINRFPLHLTALNLASQNINEKTDAIHAYNDSFFNFDPDTNFLQDSRIDDNAEEESEEEMGLFDAVVGNPPYIRHESLYPNKEHFREHLKTFGSKSRTTYYDGSKSLSKKCDAYIYFVTHATQFLREGGRLGYIIPTKWMMTRYGDSFQTFLHDHYKINAVVGFSNRSFEDALVDTALLLIERCEDESERRDTTTRFIRIKKKMEPEDIVDTADYNFNLESDDELILRNRPNYRIVAVTQSSLEKRSSSKIAHYLKAPQDLIELTENQTMVSLDTLADVSYGNKTGANDFFFLSEDDLETWPIDDRFYRPALKSYRDVQGHTVTKEDTGLYILDVNGYINEIKEDTQGLASNADLTERAKNALKRDGYDVLAEYVEHGEQQGYHNRSTLKSRDVWFNMGDLEPPQLVHPYGIDERVVVVSNADKLIPSNRVQCINIDPEVKSDVFAGYLNSTVHSVLLEFWGRNEGGGSLEIMTYELEEIPVANVLDMTEDEQNAISEAYKSLINGDENAQTRLDSAVLSAIGSDIEAEKLQEMRSVVTESRVQGAKETDVLVGDLDQFDEVGTRSFHRGGLDDDPDSGSNSSLSDF
ncbi:N-6 DNA methylase [Halorubrum ejinorense]|uniref:site-specific DNA-methyltransferase (adenine-specific) n=1 Tax=Halorubrum ejinorense TaxID=425309 RepID=A0AAV3SQP9_9EURY